MPVRYWAYDCGCAGPEHFENFCRGCGSRGRPMGWRMTEDEKLQAFAGSTGLPPSGPVRTSEEGRKKVAALVTCPLCDGEGLLQPRDRDTTWAWCLVCDGMGAVVDAGFYPFGDVAMGLGVRYLSTGYHHDGKTLKPERGNLREEEDNTLIGWLHGAGLPDAPLVPAIHELTTGLIAVGPTYASILSWAFSAGIFPVISNQKITQGFIHLEDSTFLRGSKAMEAARSLGLTLLPFDGLEPQWLDYHAAVPFGVVRWETAG